MGRGTVLRSATFATYRTRRDFRLYQPEGIYCVAFDAHDDITVVLIDGHSPVGFHPFLIA
jgi:hypothetical protein